jgi:hypothetical protein
MRAVQMAPRPTAEPALPAVQQTRTSVAGRTERCRREAIENNNVFYSNLLGWEGARTSGSYSGTPAAGKIKRQNQDPTGPLRASE